MGWSASDLMVKAGLIWSLQFGRNIHRYFSEAPLDKSSWEEMRKKLDFNEIPPEVAEPSTTEPLNFNFPMVMEILRFGGIALIILLLVFILVRLVVRKKKASESEKTDEKEAESGLMHAETPMDMLWSAFQTAKTKGDFKEALRLLYQIAIKKLSKAKLVEAHPDKTNWEYVSEITDPSRAGDFSKITLLYETHWYGNEDLTSSTFLNHEPRFMSFIEALPDEK